MTARGFGDAENKENLVGMRRGRWVAALLASSALVVASTTVSATEESETFQNKANKAQEATDVTQLGQAAPLYAFDIAPQSLATALDAFSQVTGWQFGYTSDVVTGVASPAVRGRYTGENALRLLLSGSGLTFSLMDDGTAIITRADATGSTNSQSDPVVLSPLVVTASGRPQPLVDAPASISVIPREELENKQFASLHDALRTIPGVRIIGGSNGEDSGISIRGMEDGQTLVLVDGRRINSSEANPRGGGGDLESNWIPPIDAIDRVEVVRGPMSSLYGADAVGGVVNVITRKVSSEWTGSVGISYLAQGQQEIGDQRQADFYVSGPLHEDYAGIQFWGYNKLRDEDEFVDGTQESDKLNLNGRLWLTPTPDHDVMLEYGVARQDYNRTADNSGDGSDAQRQYDRDSWAIAHTGRWNIGISDIQLYRETTERTSPLSTSQTPTNATNTVLDGKFTTFIDDHVATIGYQWTETTSDKSDFRDLDDPDSEWGSRSVAQSAYFVEDEWEVFDSLTLTGGVRLTDHEIYGRNWSPRGYAVWRTSPRWTVKGGVGTGFKAPEIREIEPQTGATQAKGAVLAFGNPDLQPEESTSYEMGVYYDDNRTFRASATVFRNEFENKIINSGSYAFYYADGTRVPARSDCTPSDPPTTACPAWGTWLNLPGAKVHGIELEASWQATKKVNIAGSYTYSHSKITAGDLSVTAPNGESIDFNPGGLSGLDGQPLAGVPEHAATLTVTYDPIDSVRTFLRGSYESEVTSVSFGQGNSVRYQPESLTTIDLGASWQANPSLTFSAVLYNVFDETRYDPDRVGEAGLYQYPEDGRRFWLSMRTTF